MSQSDSTEEAVSPAHHSYVRDDKPEHDDWVHVTHVTPEEGLSEAGFDLTDFDTARRFENLLAELDLNPEHIYREEVDAEYAKIDKSPDDPDSDHGVFVWANENLALITGNNPLTGEYSDPDMRPPEKGYASYIGLSGTPEAVEEAFDRIKEVAAHIKAEDPEGRQFI